MKRFRYGKDFYNELFKLVIPICNPEFIECSGKLCGCNHAKLRGAVIHFRRVPGLYRRLCVQGSRHGGLLSFVYRRVCEMALGHPPLSQRKRAEKYYAG